MYLGISEDTDTKLKILKAITRKFQLSPDVCLEEVAARCPANLTGADLYSLCSDAMLTAFRKQIAELERLSECGTCLVCECVSVVARLGSLDSRVGEIE